MAASQLHFLQLRTLNWQVAASKLLSNKAPCYAAEFIWLSCPTVHSLYYGYNLQKPKTPQGRNIGPVLIHQRKDWKTYATFFKFSDNRMPMSSAELEGVHTYGADGERALIYTLIFALMLLLLLFALFLRCFMHFRDSIEPQLSERGLSSKIKSKFLNEIVGKQDGNIYAGLVDYDTEGELNNKLMALKSEWDTRETERRGTVNKTNRFYAWFLEKTAILL